MLISCLNYKGGQGKSLWTAILAGWAGATEVLDLDPRQGDAHQWADDAGVKSQLIWRNFDSVMRAAAESPDWFVADLPPHEGDESKAALRFSHLVVIPVTPSGSQDARAWGRMRAALEDARNANPGMKAAVVINANRQTALARDFVEALQAWHAPSTGRGVMGVVPQRVALAEAFAAGKVPTDPAVEVVLKRLRVFTRK